VGIAPALNHVAPSLQNGPLFIPANQQKSFTSKYTLPVDISVIAVAPHMHLVGKSLKAFAVKTPGDTNRLVDIPQWDFHWQRTYSFTSVQKLSKGTVLWANASYDNTTANPLNPNKPPKAVSLGEGTADEMLLVYFWYALYQTGDENIIIDASAPKNISSVVAIKNNPLKLYPNPVQNILHLAGFGRSGNEINIAVYSTNGKLVKQFNGKPGTGNLDLDVSDLYSGVYVLKVQENDQYQSLRFIKD
jgi:hypothetical protein